MKRIIKLLLLFFAYQLAVTAVCAGLFMWWNHSTEIPGPTSEFYITFLLVVQVVFTALLSTHLIVGKYVTLQRDKQQRFLNQKIWLLSFALIVGLGLWNNYLNELADLPNTMEQFLKEMMTHPLGILATVVMAPIMEELLFRGAMQGYLLRTWKNPMWAIIVSSFLFGAVHGNPAQVPFAFVVGLGLGWVYYKTGSLLPCVFMHFINNASAVLIYWLTNGTKTSLIEACGLQIASVLAVCGVIITALSVVGMLKCSQEKPVNWYKLQD